MLLRTDPVAAKGISVTHKSALSSGADTAYIRICPDNALPSATDQSWSALLRTSCAVGHARTIAALVATRTQGGVAS